MKYLISIFASLALAHGAIAADVKKEEPKKEVAKPDVKKEPAKSEGKKEDLKKEGEKPKVKPIGKDGKPVDEKKSVDSTKK